MSLRFRIFLAILISAVISALLAAVPLYLGSQKLAQEGGDREFRQIQGRLEASMADRVQTALSMATVVAAMPRVQRAVDKQDTKGLHRLFVKNFGEVSASTGVAQFQFHSPDAISILRVHKPDLYGDDLSGFRRLVVAANQQQRALAGLERGRAGLGIRGIAPVRQGNDHVGTVEFGLRFDSAFLEDIFAEGKSSVEMYLLPDDSIADFSSDDSGLQRVTAYYDGPPLLSASDIEKALQGDPLRKNFPLNDAPAAGQAYVVNDFSGKPVAIAHIIIDQTSLNAITDAVLWQSLIGIAVALGITTLLAFIFGRQLTQKLTLVMDRMSDLSQGKTDIALDDLAREKGEIGHMANRLVVFRDGLVEAETLRTQQTEVQAQQSRVVKALETALRRVAKGNLDAAITEDFGADYQQLMADYNHAIAQLRDVITAIAQSAQAVSESADHISNSTDDLSNRAEHTAATLEETAAALQHVTSAVSDSTAGARAANDSGQSAINKARAGADIVSGTVSAMTEIDNSAKEISRISDIIDDIAFQTNLLAVNAGVEAARAGNAGSGFAVVAAEVRSLAQRTTEAARQIKTLISTSGERVQHGVQFVNETGAALDDILHAVEEVTSQIRRIAELSEEQSQGLNDVNLAVSELDKMTQKNAEMFQKSAADSRILLTEGKNLKALVGQFEVSAQSGFATSPQVETEQAA